MHRIPSGSFFGEDFILTEARRAYNVIAVNFLDVYTVQRSALYEILDTFHLPRTRSKIRIAMIRLAFFRRIRPLIYQVRPYPLSFLPFFLFFVLF